MMAQITVRMCLRICVCSVRMDVNPCQFAASAYVYRVRIGQLLYKPKVTLIQSNPQLYVDYYLCIVTLTYGDMSEVLLHTQTGETGN